MYDRLAAHAAYTCGNSSTFEYDMIAPMTFGTALPGGSFTLREADDDLWIAEFRYESISPLQSEDWLRLHRDAGRIPMFAIYAAEDFGLEKGGARFIGGRAEEVWELMAESWFWLFREYCAGLTPEDLLPSLRSVEQALLREDWDQSVEEVIDACIEHLEYAAGGCGITGEMLRSCRESKDYPGLWALQCQLADSVLWQADRSAKYLACLRHDADVWQGVSGEEA